MNEPSQEAREALAQIHASSGNQAAAFTLREVGAVGFVLEAEVRALDKILSTITARVKAETREECAQAAERVFINSKEHCAAAIRALKDQPQ